MAVGRFRDIVIFVPWVVPGDIVDVQILRKRKKFGKLDSYELSRNLKTGKNHGAAILVYVVDVAGKIWTILLNCSISQNG
jgi:hypothetical protein